MNIYRGRPCKEYSLTASLYDCIEDSNNRGVRYMLIEKEADPNIILLDTGISPFHLIIGNESEDFALQTTKLILQCGGNPNVKSEDGLTPLHIASAWGRLKIVELLIHFGADYEIKDNNYQTAIDYAVEHSHTDIAKFLYDEYKVNVNITNIEEIKTYFLSLDKILVNNGISEAEYEVDRSDDNLTSTTPNLQLLPETNSYEYVSNWCNHHAKSPQNNFEDNAKPKENEAIFNGFDCYSTNKRCGPIISNNINCNPRKPNYSVIENISLDYECSSKFRTRKNLFLNKDDSITNTTQQFGKFKELSRESGILTISNSSLNSITSVNKLDTDKKRNNSFGPRNECNKDTSSDYFTCHEISGSTNILEKNIFDITSDCSILHEDKINNTDINCSESNGAVGNELNDFNLNLSHDASCVGITEIYKYTDQKEGVTLLEKRFLISQSSDTENGSVSQSSKLSSLPASFDYDSDTLRFELTQCGFPIGPVTKTTKRVYLRKLYKLKKDSVLKPAASISKEKKVYSVELENTLSIPNSIKDSPVYKNLEETLYKEFNNPDTSRKWREGLNKSSFSYLLLDPRLTQNLPNRAEQISLAETWKTFLDSIFYVGKGKRSRPYSHLYDAVGLWHSGITKSSNKKIQHILDIWNDNYGVVCLHVFQNVIPVEAYTREAAMIKALKLENLKNNIVGQFYGTTLTWSSHQQNMLGVLLLYKAMLIFLNEGERQLRPSDIN